MDNDNLFRLILFLSLLLIVPVTLYHRLKAHRPGERLNRREEGLLILLTLRPMGLATIVGLTAYIIQPSSMAWSALALAPWIRWVGVGLGLISTGLFIWTLRTLGNNLTDTVVTRQVHTLVTHGPYAWVRHPFYSSFGLLMVANGITAANWFILLTGAATFGLLTIRCRREEENLVSRFGDEYRNYVRHTGRFVPKISL